MVLCFQFLIFCLGLFQIVIWYFVILLVSDTTCHLLQFLGIAQAIISVIETDVNIKKEKKRLDEIVDPAYNILKHEKRDYIDGRPILRKLLHLRSSIPMYELNEFMQKLGK